MVKLASVLLIIQNLLIYALVSFASDFDAMLNLVFYLDLIGFSLLAIGFYIRSKEHEQSKDPYLIAAGGVLGWLVNRMYWQYTVDVETITENRFTFAFVLSAVFLLISGFSKLDNRYFMFTSVNLAAVLLMFLGSDTDVALIGVYTKIFVVPIFAIIAFWSLYSVRLDQSLSVQIA